jgi:hypothetical protein
MRLPWPSGGHQLRERIPRTDIAPIEARRHDGDARRFFHHRVILLCQIRKQPFVGDRAYNAICCFDEHFEVCPEYDGLNMLIALLL